MFVPLLCTRKKLQSHCQLILNCSLTKNNHYVEGMSCTDSRGVEVKVVVVGDGAVGKTCLCNVFLHRDFPTHYEPTIFENYCRSITVDGKPVFLQLWDTAGQEGFERIRILGYENTQCFVVCFSVVDPSSFANVKSVWLKELRENQPEAKILLVGTKADLRGRNSLGEDAQEVSLSKIQRLVRNQRLDGYVETSAIRGADNVDNVFFTAMRLVVAAKDDGGAPDSLRQKYRSIFSSCFK